MHEDLDSNPQHSRKNRGVTTYSPDAVETRDRSEGSQLKGLMIGVVEQDIRFSPLISSCAYMARIFRHIQTCACMSPLPQHKRVMRELRFYPTIKLTSEPATLLDAGKGHKICSLGTKILELELKL